MPEDDNPSPEETQPPGPQPDDPPTSADDEEHGDATGPGVDENSEDSFPASDPPAW
jgi:hypothetical protein